MRRFRLIPVLVAAAMTAALLPYPAHAADEAPVTEVTIIHDTHMHGNFEMDGKNIAQKATIINEIRSRQPNAVFVGVGDDLGTSLLSSEFKGSQSIDAFNRMGLAVDGIGNHDFDDGPDNLLNQVPKANFPFVNANLKDVRTGDVFGAEVGIKEYVILDVNGVKVGFTSLAPIDTAEISSPGPNVQILDYAEAMNAVLPKMEADGAEVTVLLSHICGPDADRLAAEVDGIDVIVGDHCAEALEQPKVINNTIVSRVGDEYDYVGELTLLVQNGDVIDHKFTRHEITADTPEDPEIKALMDSYTAQLDEKFGEVIGYTAVPLDSVKSNNRLRETGLANYIGDVTRAYLGADITITNGGNIRADKIFEPGPLTKRDIVDILPFTNYIMMVETTGAKIKEALELGVSTIEEGHGRFPQVSGISFKLDPTKPVGERVSDIMVGDKPLDPNATYKFAANSYLIVDGGDGYTMFQDDKQLVDPASAPLVTTVVMEAIERDGTIAPRTEGRILFVNGVSLEVGRPELIIAGRSQQIDVAPEMKDGQMYLPFRWIGELYGALVEWDQETLTASATMPWGTKVSVTEGQEGYTVNDRMLVPVSVLEEMGLKVTVDGNTAHLGL